jgi:hypothetical protein
MPDDAKLNQPRKREKATPQRVVRGGLPKISLSGSSATSCFLGDRSVGFVSLDFSKLT